MFTSDMTEPDVVNNMTSAESGPESPESVDSSTERGPAGKKPQAPPLSAKEEWSEFFRTALIAVLLALSIRTFLYEPFNIPSSSMKPTLEVGDYLFVYKPAYGFSRFSFPFGLAPIKGRIWSGGQLPARGETIVFRLPSNTSIDYIKRIVGLPGDRIQVIDGRLYINRQIVPREPVGLKRVEEPGSSVTMMEYIETLPGDIRHYIYEEGDDKPLDNTEEYTVPPGHYFAMGDNRDNSQDSRVLRMVGYIPLQNIVGRASFLFFSTDGSANLAQVWKWPMSIRYDRLFKPLKPLPPATEPTP